MFSNISSSQKLFVMIGVMLSMLLAALDQTIVATALPKIIHDLNGLEHLSWVITSYLLASTIVVPIYGKLSDLYGRKYFIIFAVVVFLVGSILSGFSQNMIQLVIFRGLQGIGGGGIFANSFAIIGDLFPPAQRGKWQGLFGGVFGIASVIGPFLGGIITDNFSWRWVFFVNIPVGILALLVIGFLMPKISSHKGDKSIDYIGSIFLTIGLITLLLGFVWGGNQYAWNSIQIISLFASSVISLLTFGFVETKAKNPILPLFLFKNPIFSLSMLIVFIMGFGMFGAIFYAPIFGQIVLGISATNSGTIIMPMTLAMVVSSITTGQIVSRTGKYKIAAVLGLAVAAFGMYILSTMNPVTSQLGMIYRMIITGIGLGIGMPIFNLIVQNSFEHSLIGVATASTQLFRSIGGTVGTAIFSGIFVNSLKDHLGNLSSDPFLQTIVKINPSFNAKNIDVNRLQGFLSGEGKTQIQNQLFNLPPAIQPQAIAAFNQFVEKIKGIFSSSITEVFLIASFIMAAGFLASLFLKEIPLRQSHSDRPFLEEAGVEIGESEGEIPAKDEMEIFNKK